MSEALTRFEALASRKRKLEEELKAVGLELKEAERDLLEEFSMTGMQRATLNGTTVFLRNDRYVRKATGVPTEQVCKVLTELGYGELVNDNYPAATLKAMVCDWMDTDSEIPPKLEELLSIGTVPRIIAQKAS